jgi:tetratricopeptide (TPR) repeat protein
MVGIAAHLNTTLTLADGATTSKSVARRIAEPGTAYAAESLETPKPNHPTDEAADQENALHGQEWFALGQHYVKQSQPEQARAAFEKATTTLIHAPDRGAAFQELAALHKRAGDWEQACATWQLWISSVPGNDPTPYIELAKHAEWQSRDLGQAEMWTAWAIHNLKQADPRTHHRNRLPELEHRLERLRRKRTAKDSA